ncbi:hypothetical protein CDAR_183301 [Caerostris darwini]|uniref:Uncharacterized protein n=1 Tax=Caerostris darwini TaxID=1538125 RepID=A0AAV4WN46_9ARAC|nr:hypothetical protein CDAR_183301 [Caerostris darwini]
MWASKIATGLDDRFLCLQAPDHRLFLTAYQFAFDIAELTRTEASTSSFETMGISDRKDKAELFFTESQMQLKEDKFSFFEIYTLGKLEEYNTDTKDLTLNDQ